jgi:4-oxalocrotonate tautomerase
MPHVVVKVRTGYAQAKKARLADALSKALVETLDCPKFDVSVGIEDIEPDDWAEHVYRPDILGRPETIYLQPGYALPK